MAASVAGYETSSEWWPQSLRYETSSEWHLSRCDTGPAQNGGLSRWIRDQLRVAPQSLRYETSSEWRP
ncbi:hypothetical protein NDU88_000162 [Pleurodeles waltl]|uniref:Uncharacterized protein n=1 Tax=Pleurodeles waltl TaxID=8319 RepID=A0AAV7NGG4_PLEWA|nr:hypothetical protein NDU88_000162 [Pleurodeles waltl]